MNSQDFFDINYWNNSNDLYKVVQHNIEDMITIEYIGSSEMRICVCVYKKDIEYGIKKFWKEFKRLSENIAIKKINVLNYQQYA